MIESLFMYSLIVSGGLLFSIRFSNMSDKKKIQKIFEYTKMVVVGRNGEIKQTTFIRKAPLYDQNKIRNGTEYVYRLPLGLPYKKLEYLNDNVGVFKDGLHKNVEISWDGGMLHLSVYENDLPEKWDYKEVGPLPGWEVPIGRNYKELVCLDFDKTPHMVGGGTTRKGKTVFMKGVMTSLIENHPDDVEFFLIDLKAGVEFDRYRNLKQVKGVAKDVHETHTLLTEAMESLAKRQIYFRHMKYSNIVETPIKERTFIIIDEAGDLIPESFMSKELKDLHKECQAMLAHIARIGGAFGFRELFFSQYTTADVLPRQIKQNADAKICFKIQNSYASEVVLGEGNTQAADLPNIPGRAMFRDGSDMCELQVPLITDKEAEKILGQYMEGERKEVFAYESDRGEDIIKVKSVGDA